MTARASTPAVNERDLYPLHEEDDVPEIPRHERQNGYLRPALRAQIRGGFVTGNACIYWEPDNTRDYVAPDVFVVPNWRPEKEPRVYWLWEDPPIAFVAEVFSASDTAAIRQDKETKYARHVQAPEYLSYDEERRELKLRRLEAGGYEEVTPLPNGRVRSEQLQLEFGYDEEGFLWIYTMMGEKLPCYEEWNQRAAEEVERRQDAEARAVEAYRHREEETRRRQEAETRAAEEVRRRQEAETRAAEEARHRQEAEARAAEEARHRQEAEARAAEEARHRQEAEARAAELEREVAALRARLQEGDD